MSLMPMSRLITLMARSPSWPPMPTINPVKISCVAPKNGNEKRKAQGKRHGHGKRSHRALPGFPGADVAAQRMFAKKFTKRERGDIVQFRREQQIQQIAVGVAGIGQEGQMAKHPSQVNKTDNGQGELLQLPVDFVPQDGNQQDERHHIDRQHNEQPVPTLAGFLALRLRNQRRNPHGGDSQIHRARHPPVPIQSRRPGKFLETKSRDHAKQNDGRNAPRENANQ